MKKLTLEDAKYWFKTAKKRMSEYDVSEQIESMKACLAEAGKNLNDLGTSEKEIAEILNTGYLSKARGYLKEARKKTNWLNDSEDVTREIKPMRDLLIKADKSLEDIGTNKKELEELVLAHHVSKAKYWLKSTREKALKDDVSDIIEYIKKPLTEAGKSLKDIGTDEKEIGELVLIGYASKAKSFLEVVRRKKDEDFFPYSVDILKLGMEFLVKSGKSLEYIGTDEKEIEALINYKHVFRARHWLGEAKRKKLLGDDVSNEIEHMKKSLAKADRSLEYIGTDEKEIGKLLSSDT